MVFTLLTAEGYIGYFGTFGVNRRLVDKGGIGELDTAADHVHVFTLVRRLSLWRRTEPQEHKLHLSWHGQAFRVYRCWGQGTPEE